jgi:phosphoglucan,water dikinase
MWQRLGGFSHPDEALRLRATLQRVIRLADAYSTVLVNSLSGAASVLGNALGVPDYQSVVFPESEVRANVVFQLSKLTSLLLKATTLVCHADPWDVIAGGCGRGRLIEIPTLDAQTLKDALPHGETAIVVVPSATGDEEVGSLGPVLQGVILLQQLPHLSHLGVRARQENVPFVTCDDADTVNATVRGLIGQQVELRAIPDGVTVAPSRDLSLHSDPEPGSKSLGKGDGLKNATNNVILCTELTPVALVDATTERCGVKASNCGRLLRLQSSSPFQVPDGMVIPFGAMDIVMNLKENGDARVKFDRLLHCIADAVEGVDVKRLDVLCLEMEELITGLHLPDSFLDKLVHAGNNAGHSDLIVRSSANVEDLEGMSGAGLFESIPNVRAGDAAALSSAITKVWASLYSRRAVLSLANKSSSVDRTFEIDKPQMAVIVQSQVSPALSFVLHTSHPLSRDDGAEHLVAEVAPGLGVTLASASRGSPWRLEVSKSTGEVKTTSFANFSTAYNTGPQGSKAMVMDYSSQPMSVSIDFRKALGRRLLELGLALESEFEGCPQDVEGCIDMNDQLYVVQSRPQ